MTSGREAGTYKARPPGRAAPLEPREAAAAVALRKPRGVVEG
jgi:hypothetical protein